MGEIYVFEVFRGNKRKKRVLQVEVPGTDIMHLFDMAIRRAYEYNGWDHCVEFFRDADKSQGLGMIDPYGSDTDPELWNTRVCELGLRVGDKLGYLYDFGRCLWHTVELMKIRTQSAEDQVQEE